MCLDKGLLTKILTVGGTEMVFTSRNCLTFYKKALYLFLLLFNFETSLFNCLWLGWVFISAPGPPLVAVTGGSFFVLVPRLLSGFFCCSAQALDIWASIVVACGL